MSQAVNEQPVVAAINTFYESVWQSGPYKESCAYEVLQSSPILCTLFHSNASQCAQISKAQIFVCDQSSFSLLKSSFLKVSVLAEGIAWPHVTVCGSHLAIQWIMFGNEMDISPKSLKLPSSFIWFIVSPIFQKVFEYTISLLNLDVKHITTNIIHRTWSVSLTVGSCVPTKVENVILKMIVISPGNLFVTIMPTHNVSHHVQEFTAKRYNRTLCVASKCSPWYRETESTRPFLNNQTDLDHHIIINEIPGNLQSIVDLTIKEISDHMPTVMNIREEPISDSKTGPSQNDLPNYIDNEAGTSRCNPPEATLYGDKGKRQMIKKEQYNKVLKFDKGGTQVQRSNKFMHGKKLLKYSKYPNSFRLILLHCPKCDKEFRFGSYGNGLMYLIAHIYENHKRLTSYCMSTIRRKYANVINVADQGKTCRFKNDNTKGI